jgi:hypothetical protein
MRGWLKETLSRGRHHQAAERKERRNHALRSFRPSGRQRPRLHGNHKFLSTVARTIGGAFENFGDVTNGEACTVSYHELPILGSPFDCDEPPRIKEDDVIDYCNRVIGDQVGHTIMTLTLGGVRQ